MAVWVNHVAVAMPRNGTTGNTVDPASSGTVVAGTRFTPTAGRLLVLIVDGSVTTSTPSGWTLPTGGSAINNTGLYVWHRSAAGSDTVSSTHGAADYPLVFDWYEFPAGSTFVASASAISVTASPGGAGPTLSGLTGTNLIFGVAGQSHIDTGAITWTWASGVESVDTYADAAGTDGYSLGVAYLEDSALTSASIAATSNNTNANVERLMFAVNVAVDPDATVAAVAAQGTGAAVPPAVSNGAAPATVDAVRAQGSGSAPIPAVSGETVISGGSAATATGMAHPPVVTGGSPVGGTVVAVCALGTGIARAPGVNVVETLPSNTGTGRVTARFATAEVLVGDDDGIPNIYPVTAETVTFTSTAAVLLNATADPDAIVILPRPIVCSLDAQGYMVDSAGHKWCDLIATDDADLTPAGRKWTVSFSSGLGITSFPISVAGGSTVDLTALIPT